LEITTDGNGSGIGMHCNTSVYVSRFNAYMGLARLTI
jgi:hypothetical protein